MISSAQNQSETLATVFDSITSFSRSVDSKQTSEFLSQLQELLNRFRADAGVQRSEPGSVPQQEASSESGSGGTGYLGGLIRLQPASGAATGGDPAQPVTPNSPALLTTSPDSEPYAKHCRAVVDSALESMGLDPRSFQMSFWEEVVPYPGGGYMNRCITVQTPAGYKMDFDAAATLRAPKVTAESIRMLAEGYWDTPSAAPNRLNFEIRS